MQTAQDVFVADTARVPRVLWLAELLLLCGTMVYIKKSIVDWNIF
jgi:hypothetical protein